MATTQSSLFNNLSYVNEIKDQIVNSGGTIVFMKNNVIVASEISEAEYRELLNSPYIDKLDVLPLKRYGNEGVKYNESVASEFVTNTTFENTLNLK